MKKVKLEININSINSCHEQKTEFNNFPQYSKKITSSYSTRSKFNFSSTKHKSGATQLKSSNFSYIEPIIFSSKNRQNSILNRAGVLSKPVLSSVKTKNKETLKSKWGKFSKQIEIQKSSSLVHCKKENSQKLNFNRCKPEDPTMKKNITPKNKSTAISKLFPQYTSKSDIENLCIQLITKTNTPKNVQSNFNLLSESTPLSREANLNKNQNIKSITQTANHKINKNTGVNYKNLMVRNNGFQKYGSLNLKKTNADKIPSLTSKKINSKHIHPAYGTKDAFPSETPCYQIAKNTKINSNFTSDRYSTQSVTMKKYELLKLRKETIATQKQISLTEKQLKFNHNICENNVFKIFSLKDRRPCYNAYNDLWLKKNYGRKMTIQSTTKNINSNLEFASLKQDTESKPSSTKNIKSNIPKHNLDNILRKVNSFSSNKYTVENSPIFNVWISQRQKDTGKRWTHNTYDKNLSPKMQVITEYGKEIMSQVKKPRTKMIKDSKYFYSNTELNLGNIVHENNEFNKNEKSISESSSITLESFHLNDEQIDKLKLDNLPIKSNNEQDKYNMKSVQTSKLDDTIYKLNKKGKNNDIKDKTDTRETKNIFNNKIESNIKNDHSRKSHQNCSSSESSPIDFKMNSNINNGSIDASSKMIDENNVIKRCTFIGDICFKKRKFSANGESELFSKDENENFLEFDYKNFNDNIKIFEKNANLTKIKKFNLYLNLPFNEHMQEISEMISKEEQKQETEQSKSKRKGDRISSFANHLNHNNSRSKLSKITKSITELSANENIQKSFIVSSINDDFYTNFVRDDNFIDLGFNNYTNSVRSESNITDVPANEVLAKKMIENLKKYQANEIELQHDLSELDETIKFANYHDAKKYQISPEPQKSFKPKSHKDSDKSIYYPGNFNYNTFEKLNNIPILDWNNNTKKKIATDINDMNDEHCLIDNFKKKKKKECRIF